MTLAHPLARPRARIGRSLVWTTDDESFVVKYIRHNGASPPDELRAARAVPQGVAPTFQGFCVEATLPTGEYGPWLALWYERFPYTLLTWGKLDEAQTVELFRQIHVLHGAGVYHRDIHARNIVMRWNRGLLDIRLIDFGRARISTDLDERVRYADEDWRSFDYSALRRMITVSKVGKSFRKW